MKKKMSKRILSIVLALTMTFSGLSLDGIKAYAGDVSEGETVEVTEETEILEETVPAQEIQAAVDKNEDVSSTEEESGVDEELAADPVDGDGYTKEATIELPAGTYVENAGGEPLKATITWYYLNDEYGYSYRDYFSESITIPEYDNRGSSTGTTIKYQLHYGNEKYLSRKYYVGISFGYDFKGNTNLLRASYYFNSKDFTTSYEGVAYDLAFASKVSLRVATISGTLTLPSDVPAPEGNISYYIYVGNSYYTSITIPAGVDHIGYQISSFDSSKDEVQYFVMGYDYSPSYSTGLYTGWCYYDAATGKLVQALSKADAISKAAGFGVEKFKNGLNLTIPKASTTLTLTLPEGLDELEEEEYEGQVYAYYAQENGEEKETKSYFSFSTKDEKAVVYLNQVPDCAGELIRIMIPIGGKISGANTLLVNSGSSYYYSGKCLAYTDEGLICCEKYEAPTVDISEEKNLEAELLPTPVVCNVTAPEGTDLNGDDYLSGNIKIYYKETAGGSVKSVEKTFTINADDIEKGARVYFNNLSPDIYSIEKIEYVDNHYSYPNANIAQCTLFYTPSGPVSTEANAAKPGYSFGVMNEYELPLALAPVKVNVHHNTDVVFIGEVEDYNKNFSYTIGSEIKTGSYSSQSYTGKNGADYDADATVYLLKWPIDELEIPYVSLNVSGISKYTNLITGSNEYITETGLTSDKSEAESFTRTNNKQVLEIDVTPAVTNMRVKFELDEDVYITGGELTGWFYYRAGSLTSDKSITVVYSEAKRSNEFFLNDGIPCDATTISKLYYHIVRNSSYEHTETNLMLDRNLYLAETPIDSETGEMRYQRAETGTSLPIPTDGTTITFPIHKAEALVPVNITLPEGARVIGSSLIGTITAQYTDSYKDKVTTSFEILPGETETTAYLGLPSGVTSIYKLEYYISTSQDCGTNVKRGYGTYTETGWNVTSRNETKTPFPYTLLTDQSGANPHIDIELVKARSISGTISLPESVYVDDDVTIKVEVSALGEAESYADSISCKCVFTKDVRSVDYLLEIPEDTDTIEQFYVDVVKLNYYGCSNIINGKYFLTEDGGFEVKDSYSYECDYVVATVGDIEMNFVLKQTKSIKGTINIPEDAFVQGEGDAYVEMSFKISGEKENGSYISNFEDQRSYIIYPTDKVTSYEYEIPIDPEMASVTQIQVSADAKNGAKTNLFDNGGYFMQVNNKTGYKTFDSTKGEIGWNQNDDFELETTETVTSFDIAWHTSKVITGTITFDEDCVSSVEGSAEIALAGFTKSNYTLSDYARSEDLHFDLSKSRTYEYWYLVQPDIIKVDYFCLELSGASDDDTEGNVYWHWVYYGENGEIVSSKEAATKKVPIDKAVNTVNWTINASPVVTGTITLPENATYKSTDKKYGLEATIGFYQEHSTDRYELYDREYDRDNSIDNYGEAVPCDTVYFVNGARTATYRVILCPECKKVNYVKLKYGNYSSYYVTTNIDSKTIYYFGINGEVGSYSEDIAPYDVTGNFEFSPMLPTPKTLKGRVSICEGGYFNGSDIKVTLDPVVKGKKGSYTQTLEITSSRPYADYSIEIPAEVSRIDYIEVTATGKNTSIDTNLYLDKALYQGGGDNLQSEAGQATPIVFSEATLTKNIVLECYKVIMGKVSLPEDATVSGNLKGKVYAVIGTNTVNSDEFSVSTTDREASYQIKLPAGSAVIDKLYVDTDRQAETTVRTGIAYYNATKGEWHSVEEYAEGFNTTGGSTEINMELPLSVELKGTISIPEGGYLNSGYVHGFVLANDFDFGSGYFEYMGGDCGYSEFSIQAGKEGSCEYTISLPLETKKIKDLSINIDTESEEDSNAFTDGEVFLGNDGWQYDELSSAEFDFSSNKSITRNLNIPLGVKAYGTVTSPDYINDALVTVSVDYEGDRRSDDAYFYNGVYHYSIGFLAEESDEYVLSYILDSDEENYACTRVYVNADDTYTLSERAVTTSQFAAGPRTITLARWSDFVEDVLLESAHPYADADIYALSYTYPGTADALKITFTDNTYLGEGDRIEILNKAGTLVGECYYSDALSGTTITIPGTGFTVKLYADEAITSYGFGISSIEAVNGSFEGTTKASIAYENGNPVYAVIINTGDEDVYMCLNTTEYNAAGRMVSIKPAKLTVSKGMMAVELAGASNPTAVKTKYILYDSAFVPLIKSVQ